MILLIGHGYIGSAFAQELKQRRADFIIFSHEDVTRLAEADELFSVIKPELVINCAAFIPQESVSLCDKNPVKTLIGNVMFPAVLAVAAADKGIPFAHISTSCLWSDGREHSEADLTQRAFNGHCGFYIGTKVLAEKEVRKWEKHYIWRVRLPFDEFDSDRNYLSKLIQFKEVWCQENSACHRADCAKACLDLWDLRAPFGTYHVNNPGVLNTTDIVCRMQRLGLVDRIPHLIDRKDGECRPSPAKMIAAGVKIRPVEEALQDSLKNWIPRNQLCTV